MEKFEQRMINKMPRDRISGIIVRARSDVTPIEKKMQKYRLLWFGHLYNVLQSMCVYRLCFVWYYLNQTYYLFNLAIYHLGKTKLDHLLNECSFNYSNYIIEKNIQII